MCYAYKTFAFLQENPKAVSLESSILIITLVRDGIFPTKLIS